MDEFVRKPKGPKINLDTETTASSVPANSGNIIQPSYTEQPVGQENQPAKQENKKRMPKFKFKVPTPKNKKQWIIAIIVMVLALGSAVFSVYWFVIREDPKPVVKVVQEPEPEPTDQPIYSRTSGREVSAGINERPVYAVQIENSPEARPQSGLRDADIVSEAIAEGGITRFNAIYQDNVPANIGPIRSLRPYYIDWFRPYDAAIVHAGGSGEALSDIKNLSLKDIDHGNSGAIFTRSSSRYSPHNLYSTGSAVTDLMAQRGYKSTVNTVLPRKEAKPAESMNAKNIALNISRSGYNVNFAYDQASNSYLRSQGGVAHVDAETKQQIAPNVVVVPIVAMRIHPDRVHTQYDTIGSGKVYVFQDGTVTEGTWSKPSREAQWTLKDASDQEIKLNPGQTWFSIVQSADRVSYNP